MSDDLKGRVRFFFQSLTYLILVLGALWNLWTFNQKSLTELPNRGADDLVIVEERYRDIRAALIEMGYNKGPISFVTSRDLQSKPKTPEDDRQWAQGQYVMAPWILLRKGRTLSGHTVSLDPPLVIADFWDGPSTAIPEGFNKLYDSGRGLVLYQRKPTP